MGSPALWLAFALGACGTAGTSPAEQGVAEQAILGGRETAECEWPAVVALGGCSGILVHPQLVLYAAHCGTAPVDVLFGSRTNDPKLVAKTRYCRAPAGAKLGDGSDIAYCVLQEPVHGIEPARVLAGCELDELRSGAPALVVGFGRDGADGELGTQRVGVSKLEAVGDELLLDSAGVDTCFGDSGGPLFVLRETVGGSCVLRVAGITSAGSEETCGSGTSHYVNLAKKLEWIEASSGIDISPCFDGDKWAPTPRCVEVSSLPAPIEQAVAAIATGRSPSSNASASACEAETEVSLSSSCGPAFSAPPDDEPPWLSLTSPVDTRLARKLRAGEDYLEVEVRAEAWDNGWGVEGVTFKLLSAGGSTEFERLDQVPPYEIAVLRVPPGSFTLLVQARDYAGNIAEHALSIEVERETNARNPGGCSVVSSGYSGRGGPSALLLLVLAAARRFVTRLSNIASTSK